jgi:hypothetical protein
MIPGFIGDAGPDRRLPLNPAETGPLMPFIEWRPTPERNVEVVNPTADLYRYFDRTEEGVSEECVSRNRADPRATTICVTTKPSAASWMRRDAGPACRKSGDVHPHKGTLSTNRRGEFVNSRRSG